MTEVPAAFEGVGATGTSGSGWESRRVHVIAKPLYAPPPTTPIALFPRRRDGSGD